MKPYLIVIAFALPLLAKAEVTKFESSIELYSEGKKAQAAAQLESLKKIPSEQAGLYHFALGNIYHELGKWEQAEQHLKRAQAQGKNLQPYIRFLEGKIHNAKGEAEKAESKFKTVLALRPTRFVRYEARFELGELAMAKKQWRTAYNHMIYLERRWRNTAQHPHVIWRLIEIEMERKRKWRACRWARKIYSRYPAHPLVYDWGVDLQSAKYNNKKLGCVSSHADQRSRVRRLQWAGEADRARRELETLTKRAKGSAKYKVDSLMAGFLTKEGYVHEALEILLKYYNQHNKDFNFLMDLGKTAAVAGEYQAAVGAYYKAHTLSPHSRSGRRGLYKAAFLSYQFQDYDGAARKFEEFIKRHPRSGLRRDAAWHLAWIRYLKGDYDGAVRGFKDIQYKKARHRWRWRKFSAEKINYWLAMSYYRLKKYDEARTIFKKLISDGSVGYYSLAAQYRYNTIPGTTPIRSLASRDKDLLSLNENLELLDVPTVSLPGEKNLEVAEEEESEENLGIAEEDTEGEVPVEMSEKEETPTVEQASEVEAGSEVSSESAEPELEPVVTTFRNPRLQARFDTANQLMTIGLFEWAKWELYEIERKTRNRTYLKMLMAAYEKLGFYHRSAYIGQVYFGQQRQEFGVHGVRYLWEYTYPRAYNEYVSKYAKQFSVPEEFVWSIMRAESIFRADAMSPVGARGLMQLMPNTGRQVARLLGDVTFHERQLTEPEVNIRLGTRYLNRLMKKFDQQMPLVAASYNAGPHRVESWLSSFGTLDMDEFIEHIPFIETRNYVKKVVRHLGIYKTLYREKPDPMTWLTQQVPVRLEGRPALRETWEAL